MNRDTIPDIDGDYLWNKKKDSDRIMMSGFQFFDDEEYLYLTSTDEWKVLRGIVIKKRLQFNRKDAKQIIPLSLAIQAHALQAENERMRAELEEIYQSRFSESERKAMQGGE